MNTLLPLRLLHAIGFTNLSDDEVNLYYDIIEGRYRQQKQIDEMQKSLTILQEKHDSLAERVHAIETLFSGDVEQLVEGLRNHISKILKTDSLSRITELSKNFSDREKSLVALITNEIMKSDFSNSKFIEELAMTDFTVLTTLKSIYKKLGIEFVTHANSRINFLA